MDAVSNLAIVANSGDSSVSVVDLATNRVVATIQSVSSPAGVALNSSTGIAVVSNPHNNTVTVLDIVRRQIRAVVNVGSTPTAVAINVRTNLAVVANSTGNSVSLVDLNTLREVAVVDGIPTATGIQSVAVDSDLNVAAVASSSTNSLFVVDLVTRKIRAQVSVEQSPSGVAIDPTSKTAVVTNLNSNSVSFVDLRSNTVSATVSGIPQPQAVAISPTTRSAVVTTGTNGTLEVVNLTAAAIENSIPNLPGALGVGFNENTGQATVTLPNNNSVGVVRSLGLFTIVNAASFLPGPVAASSIVSGFGFAMATSTSGATVLPLPTTLAGISVRVGNALAPLFFVSPNQINFQVPNLGVGAYRVEVLRGSTRVASGAIAVVSAAPGLFTTNTRGTGQIAALNEDGSRNGPVLDPQAPAGQAPARAGTIIQLFGTGGGTTEPLPQAGSATTGAAPTVLTPTVQIGGLPASVQYSGAAPGLVGMWQVNVRIPSNVQLGDSVSVVVTQAGRSANTATIAVK